MFEHLTYVPHVVVTGPQRSGTTIAARMIAEDTGHRFVDESEFGAYNVDQWRDECHKDRVVVQCPTMLKRIVDERDPYLFVVLMRRPLAEIHASQERIGWQRYEAWELLQFGLTKGDSAAIKYLYWNERPKPSFHLEVEYASLQGHQLWVEQEQRLHFHAKQTAPDA